MTPARFDVAVMETMINRVVYWYLAGMVIIVSTASCQLAKIAYGIERGAIAAHRMNGEITWTTGAPAKP